MSQSNSKSRYKTRVGSPEKKTQRNQYAIEKGFGDITKHGTIDTTIPIGVHSNARLTKRHKSEDAAMSAAASQLNVSCCSMHFSTILFVF